MNELEEFFAKLGLLSPEERLQAVAKLKDVAKPVYQLIFNDGHAAATGTLKPEKEALEVKLHDAEERATTVETEFAEHKAKNPDLATIESQWQAKLQQEKDKLKTFKEETKQKQIAEKQETALAKLQGFLSAKVDPLYSEALVERPSVKSRIQFDEQGNLRVLQPGQQIPYAGDGEAQLKALTEEIQGNVAPQFLTSNVEAGTQRDNTTGVPAKTSEADKYAKIREAAQKTDRSGNLITEKSRETLNKVFGTGVSG